MKEHCCSYVLWGYFLFLCLFLCQIATFCWVTTTMPGHLEQWTQTLGLQYSWSWPELSVTSAAKVRAPWTAVTRLGVTVKVLISLSLSVPRLETRSNHSPLQLGCRGIWTDWILRMD